MSRQRHDLGLASKAPFSADEFVLSLAERLQLLFLGRTLDEVCSDLAEGGYTTSRDTVRRYKEGEAQRIDAAFLAAVCVVYDVDPAWLLLLDSRAVAVSPDFRRDLADLRLLRTQVPQRLQRLVALAKVKARLKEEGQYPADEEGERLLWTALNDYPLRDDAADVPLVEELTGVARWVLGRMKKSQRATLDPPRLNDEARREEETRRLSRHLVRTPVGAFFDNRLDRFRADGYSDGVVERICRSMLSALEGAEQIVQTRNPEGTSTGIDERTFGLTENEQILVLQQAAMREEARLNSPDELLTRFLKDEENLAVMRTPGSPQTGAGSAEG